jgi:hypothetical protein
MLKSSSTGSSASTCVTAVALPLEGVAVLKCHKTDLHLTCMKSGILSFHPPNASLSPFVVKSML